jgi:hypothetical protein
MTDCLPKFAFLSIIMSKIDSYIPLSARINCFIKLGRLLAGLSSEEKTSLAARAKYENPWFVESNVLLALSSISEMLNESQLQSFVNNYSALENARSPKRVGLVLAGNIPAVGFHDVLCVLLSGHIALVKFSKDDRVLMQFLVDKIVEIEPQFKEYIKIVDRLTDIEAVICTGSDNSARYFESYFGKYPNIIRKNRTSIAVLDGTETTEELHNLGKDIFTYYGLGCRNVSKLFIPKNQDLTKIIDALESFSYIIEQHKYANNHTYNKAIYLLNQEEFLDNDFAIFKESEELNSPLSVILVERYSNTNDVSERLELVKEKVQCVVSKMPEIKNKVAFGEAQKPHLHDFADGVDTMQFLLGL